MVLDWPQRKGTKPVTTALNQAIFQAAASAMADELPIETAAFRQAMDGGTTNWRHDYIPLMEQFVRLQAMASRATVVRSCRAGLDFATESFVVRDRTSHDITVSIAEALDAPPTTPTLPTVTLHGTQPKLSTTTCQFQLASPHGTDQDPIWISGEPASAQINAWKEYGCMEPSAAEYAAAVCRLDNASKLVEGKTFCLLGITSEMGPALHLLKIPGAHVMGVARSGPKLDALRDWFIANGPVDATLQLASADLLNDFPAIANWIIATAPADQPLILMPLAYMDGEANVRVTVAMDAIVSTVLQRRNRKSVSLVYLTSPTTIYTIPAEAAMDAKRRFDEHHTSSWTNQIISAASLGKWLRPANTWKQIEVGHFNTEPPVVVYNGAFHLQGPNYCLAKLMQQWRCVVATADDIAWSVHAPHAPGTRTWSVLHNPQAAAAIEGLQYFPPMLTFDVLPCSSLLTAIILHQLHDTLSQRNKFKEQHPFELFWDGAVHGGGWRCPYSSESVVSLSFLLGKAWAKPGWCPPAALAPLSLPTEQK
jgi:hypothetical protein